MERTCSQTIKIPFPTRIFYGTEVTVDIPRTGGEILKNIKLVLDFSNSINTLGSTIVEKAEIIVGDETIQTTYGDFIQVENVLITPIEKYDKLLQLMCISSPGTMYMRIPFEDVHLGENTKNQIRLKFSSALKGELLGGYLLIDHYLYENPPKFPYVQRVTQVQKFNRTVNRPKTLKMAVYSIGSVYQLYFTVKDTATGAYVDALSNVTLNFGEKERFNLTGKYLRYVEPLKRLQTYASEPVYMYNFCLNQNTSSGSTHFPDNSVFVLDFYDNSSTYEVTIWAKSHDFLYTTENTTKRIFESTEMLLDTTTSASSLQEIPLRVSYINYSGSIVIFYASQYEISNVGVTSTMTPTITQNTVEFPLIDSVNTSYTANVVFSVQGFQDTTCYFRFRGYNTYLDNVVYTGLGNYPTHIDLGQNFHYLLGNVFDFSNVVFTSNIQSLSVDDQKNYAFTTYTTGTCNILGSTTPFTGPGSIIAKYDQNMNLLFTVSTQNSNVTELASANTYGLSFAQSGFVISRDIGYSYTANAGTATVFVDSVTPMFSSIRFGISASNISANSRTTNFGNGTNRASLVSVSTSTDPIVISNIRQVKTSLGTFSNGQPIWSFMYTSTSASSNSLVTIPSSSNGYLVWSRGWSKSITNITASGFDSKIVVDQMTDAVYLVAGYTSTTPALTGFTFANGTGFFVVKFDRSGNTKYVTSFVGTGILEFSPMIDNTTGRFMINAVTSPASLLNVYIGNGTLSYSDTGKYQFFLIDDYGNVNSSLKNLDELFGISKPIYFNPLCNSVYFKDPATRPPDYTYWFLATSGPTSAETHRYIASDSDCNLYSIVGINGGASSNIFDKYGDTGVMLTPMAGGSDAFILSTYSNCVSTRWFARITNCYNGIRGYIAVKNNFVYALVTTLPTGTSRVYDKNGTQVGPILDGQNVLLVKFNRDGTYANMHMTMSSSTGNFLSIDSANNMYISGYKDGTTLRNIIINGSTVGNIPVTTQLSTGYVIKLNASDNFSWVSYVDGVGRDGGSILLPYPPSAMTSSPQTISGRTYTASVSSISSGSAVNVYNKNVNDGFTSATGVYNTTTGEYIGSVTTAGYPGEHTTLQVSQGIPIYSFDLSVMTSEFTTSAPKIVFLLGSTNGVNWARLGGGDGFDLGSWDTNTKSIYLGWFFPFTYLRIIVKSVVPNNNGTVSISDITYNEGAGSGGSDTFSCADSAGNVYLASTKNSFPSIINSSPSDIIPATTYSASSFIVKFNPNGTYASWYSHFDGWYTYSASLVVNAQDEVGLGFEIGGLGPGQGGGDASMFINGSQISTISNPTSGNGSTFVKYSNTGTYAWNIRLQNGFMGYTSSDNIGNFIIAGGKVLAQLNILNTSGTVIGRINPTTTDAGIVLVINSDGTYSGRHGYIDGTGYDTTASQPLIDVNGNIYIACGINYFNDPKDSSVSLYDKNGYVVRKDMIYSNLYGCVVKYNSNMTLNKISL